MRSKVKVVLMIIYCVGLSELAYSQKLYAELSQKEKMLYDEHILEGQPDPGPVFIRQGYVMKYHTEYRIPQWVAYHVIPDYLKTPKREKKYATFRTDPDMENPVKDLDYTGSGYARGHMAPYFAMGGDRNKNHKYSDLFDEKKDPYDDKTIFQANYLSNIAPQDQDALNGSGGPWYALETAIRNKLVKKNRMELNVVVGPIFNDPQEYYVMTNKKGDTDIAIPDGFFQVLIFKDKSTGDYITAAFMFPHVTEREELPYEELIDYLVTVDEVEQRTGLDFLNLVSETAQKKTESVKNLDFWINKMK